MQSSFKHTSQITNISHPHFVVFSGILLIHVLWWKPFLMIPAFFLLCVHLNFLLASHPVGKPSLRNKMVRGGHMLWSHGDQKASSKSQLFPTCAFWEVTQVFRLGFECPFLPNHFSSSFLSFIYLSRKVSPKKKKKYIYFFPLYCSVQINPYLRCFFFSHLFLCVWCLASM